MIAGNAERRPPDRPGIIPIVGSRRDFRFCFFLTYLRRRSYIRGYIFFYILSGVAGDIGPELK